MVGSMAFYMKWTASYINANRFVWEFIKMLLRVIINATLTAIYLVEVIVLWVLVILLCPFALISFIFRK